MTRILVAYATKHNATTEIAESIGETLRQSAGLKVDVRAVDTIDDITSYDVVILGSAVYVSQWQPKAVDFLTNHADELAQRTVWLFSSGPTGEGDPETLLDGWSFPEALQPLVEKIQPRGVKVFHGKLDLDNLNFFERSVSRVVHAPEGDFRNWEEIQSWAKHIAQCV